MCCFAGPAWSLAPSACLVRVLGSLGLRYVCYMYIVIIIFFTFIKDYSSLGPRWCVSGGGGVAVAFFYSSSVL